MCGVYYFFRHFRRGKRKKSFPDFSTVYYTVNLPIFCHKGSKILLGTNSSYFLKKWVNSHASSISTAEEVMFDGDVRQQPTNPVMKATNMKKKLTMKNAIIARPKSGKRYTIRIHFPRKKRNHVGKFWHCLTRVPLLTALFLARNIFFWKSSWEDMKIHERITAKLFL